LTQLDEILVTANVQNITAIRRHVYFVALTCTLEEFTEIVIC